MRHRWNHLFFVCGELVTFALYMGFMAHQRFLDEIVGPGLIPDDPCSCQLAEPAGGGESELELDILPVGLAGLY